MSKNPANPANLVARQKARELLAAGVSVPAVAEAIGKNKNTIYLWMKQPIFAEKLRVEIERNMSGTRRELGQIARDAIASAGQSLQQLQRTRDNPQETTAARDRAANRLLNQAHKFGRVIDRDLNSGEACGSETFLCDKEGSLDPIQQKYEIGNLKHDLSRAVQTMLMMEQELLKAGLPVAEEALESFTRYGFAKHNEHLQADEIEKSTLFKHVLTTAGPAPADLKIKDAADRAAY